MVNRPNVSETWSGKRLGLAVLAVLGMQACGGLEGSRGEAKTQAPISLLSACDPTVGQERDRVSKRVQTAVGSAVDPVVTVEVNPAVTAEGNKPPEAISWSREQARLLRYHLRNSGLESQLESDSSFTIPHPSVSFVYSLVGTHREGGAYVTTLYRFRRFQEGEREKLMFEHQLEDSKRELSSPTLLDLARQVNDAFLEDFE